MLTTRVNLKMSEQCIIVNLKNVEHHAETYINSKFGESLLVSSIIREFVFNVALCIGLYFRDQTSVLDEVEKNRINNETKDIYDRFVAAFCNEYRLTVYVSVVEINHIKKLIEDFIINHLLAVFRNISVNTHTFTRHTLRREADGKFFYYCRT